CVRLPSQAEPTRAGRNCVPVVAAMPQIHEMPMPGPSPRKGMPSPRLNENEFRKRFLGQFRDPAFDPLTGELDKVASAAWAAYAHSRKAPSTRKAGSEFAD